MSLLTIKLSNSTKTIESKTIAPSVPYLAQKISNGTLYYPLETYTSGEGLLIKGNNIIYKVQEIDIPNADDTNVKVNNILNFINNYTTGQVCFQGNENGKFYVKAGSFISGGTNPDGSIISGQDPELPTSGGILIYDSVSTTGAMLDNYICAAHLSNIMNYILYNTLGHSYGVSFPIFTDTSESSGDSYIYTEKNEQIISKGFYRAVASIFDFASFGRGYTGYYQNYQVLSVYHLAVWWGS